MRPSAVTLEGSKAKLHVVVQVLETHLLEGAAECLPLAEDSGQDEAREEAVGVHVLVGLAFVLADRHYFGETDHVLGQWRLLLERVELSGHFRL